MTLRKLLLAIGLAASLGSVAADRNIPAGYYSAIDGKSAADLKTALHNIIYPHTEISSYSNLPRYFESTDVYPQSKRWWDMYSNIPLYAPSFWGLNREHSFPKSWWGGMTDVPAYIDLNHLYPSEADANQAKSNYPLGTVDRTKNVKFDNGVTTVGIPVSGQGGGCGFVFEPDDEYKGDFARTYFYMVTCYQNMTFKTMYMLVNGAYPTLNDWSRELLLKWSREDEVSQKEIDRNEQVWGFQNNRNPFIDFPELAEYIWGDKTGEKFILRDHMNGYTPAGTPTLINPTQGTVLDFGEVALGMKGNAKLLLHGENLTAGKNLRMAIYDNAETAGAAYFTIDGSNQGTASATAVNNANGLWVTIEYTPTELGTHDTRLVISGAGLTGSVGIGLHGECLPMPELTAPTATAASDITSDSYVANWTAAEGETVDYYVVNRTKYAGGAAETEQLVAEDTRLRIDDFTGTESYTVQSVRLGVYSPESNSINVTSAGITGVDAGVQYGFSAWPGGVLVSCSGTLRDVRAFDSTGRCVCHMPEAENNDIILLPPGVYVITAANGHKPVKVSVKWQ